MPIKEQIIKLINENPKVFSRMIKSNAVLAEWINQNSLVESENFSEKIYSAITKQKNICPENKLMKFKSITAGWGFCGKTNNCKCAKVSISSSIKKSKALILPEQKKKSNDKRKKTLNLKYGVTNAGQTSAAKYNHRKLYSDVKKVSELIKKIKYTKKLRYGNENFNNPIQIKKTFLKKLDTNYWINKFPDKGIEELTNKEKLKKLYQENNPAQISNLLNVHIQTVYRWLNKHNLRTPYKSDEEIEIVNFLISNGITNIVRNSRKIISKELDIFLPDYNIAIEYNGVYWHHEDMDHITRNYHREKFIECEKKGIQLITIFSNFWKSKPDIVKQTLLNKLNLKPQSIYARNTSHRLISTAESREFLNKNHIQGYTTSSIRYGLYNNNELVAVMTFSKPRLAIGNAQCDYELVRYASNIRVVGGASKLLNMFIKEYKPSSIISYSDNEWSDGKLYRTLKFVLDKNIEPSYWYLKPNEEKLYHRFNFSKQKLIQKGFSKDKTEKEITKEIGLLKIWDCGKKRWILNLN